MSAKAAKKFRKEARKFIEENKGAIRQKAESDVFNDMISGKFWQRLKLAWMIITKSIKKHIDEVADAEQKQEISDR